MKQNNQAIEQFRIKNGPMGSNQSDGNNGAFLIPSAKAPDASCPLVCIASDAEGWDHVSVSLVGQTVDRVPNWEEMCFVKDLFWGKHECVIQYHPAAASYVNIHPFVLHLWKPQVDSLPLPPQWMV